MTEVIWDKAAENALGKAPFFVRGMVRRKVNERVARSGGERVTLADFREAEARFRAVMGGKTENELKQIMPAENKPGVEMVIIETCHNELSNCPNVLLRTADWKRAVEDWARRNDLSEKLRARVSGDRILLHHKLKISIAGCPNGCSRPQIADLGIMGFVTPHISPEECTSCGACADACPDSAITVDRGAPPVFDRIACLGCLHCHNVCPNKCITVSEPRARALAGGKLGRHPHLADMAGAVDTPAGAVDLFDRLAAGYLENAAPGERFADFWLRALKHKYSPNSNANKTGPVPAS